MMRLRQAFKLDVMVQARNGFYVVSAIIVLIFAALLSQLPSGTDWAALLPGFAAMNLVVTTFIFVGGLVLLEKSQGVLMGLAVTPLRPREYLGAKMASLGGLAALETLAVMGVLALLNELRVHPLPLLAGLLGLTSFYTLLGFVVISPFASVNDYLMPAVGVIMLLLIPVIGLWWPSPVFYLHPLHPMLVLLGGGFAAMDWLAAVYGVLGSTLVCGVAFRIASQRYTHLTRGAC